MSMEKSSLENISKIILVYNHTAKNLMTDWKDIVFDKNKGNFDFVPMPDNSNNISCVLVRKYDKYLNQSPYHIFQRIAVTLMF